MKVVFNRDSNPGIGIPIPWSPLIFSIPNPGIGNALIPGFQDYEKWAKCPNFTWHLPEKYFFLKFWGQFLTLKLRVSRLDPNTHRFTGAIVLNKPFMCLRTFLYTIGLWGCDSVTKDANLAIILNNNGFDIIPLGSHNPAGIPGSEIFQSWSRDWENGSGIGIPSF